MTADIQIAKLLKSHDITNVRLVNELVGLFVDMAGDQLIEIERSKHKIYKGLLEQKVVKPEFMATLYKLMEGAREKIE